MTIQSHLYVWFPLDVNPPRPKDRFALPEHEPVHITLQHAMVSLQQPGSSSSSTTEQLWIAYLQAHLLAVESVISLADIFEQVGTTTYCQRESNLAGSVAFSPKFVTVFISHADEDD